MARTKTVLGDGARLTDFLGASLMARVVPPEVINEVLDAHGRNSQRIRAFPAVAGVYYVMALSLYPEAAYEAVFSAVSQGLAWGAGAAQPAAVGKASISALRIRIGAQPLAELVRRCCAPLADARIHPEAWWGSTAAPSSCPMSSTTTKPLVDLAAARVRRATRRRAAPCWPSAPRMPSWAPTWARTVVASGSCASRCCTA
jgi:hypothetical protein